MKIGCCPTFTKQSDFVTDVKKNSAIHCLHKKDRFIYFKLVKVHEDLVSMINSRNLKDDFDDLIYVNDSFLFICEDNL